MKPKRAEFVGMVMSRWPGALAVNTDRGVIVAVGSLTVALDVRALAIRAGLSPEDVEQTGLESFTVRVFGFPRG